MNVPEVQVQFMKRADGNVVLRCTRRDGSVTWQRYDKHALFFSLHDLRHFAVETTLGLRDGFYSLIASGWDITDTTGKGALGKPPVAAGLVEHVVGLLDREQSGGAAPMTAAEFNAQLDTVLGVDPGRPRFTDAQLTEVRNRIDELHNQWFGLSPGTTLDLAFNRIDQDVDSTGGKCG